MISALCLSAGSLQTAEIGACLITKTVETLSGGQRQGVAVARAAAFGSKVVIMDEPTAALGVKESRRVLKLIQDVKSRGLPIVLISHNMPHVFKVAGRSHEYFAEEVMQADSRFDTCLSDKRIA
ncbi:MAG: ATP-binding cassette domain-containing protein [Chromatiales bacterium]|jgi:ABC-type sugar transport system ATPase subunit